MSGFFVSCCGREGGGEGPSVETMCSNCEKWGLLWGGVGEMDVVWEVVGMGCLEALSILFPQSKAPKPHPPTHSTQIAGSDMIGTLTFPMHVHNNTTRDRAPLSPPRKCGQAHTHTSTSHPTHPTATAQLTSHHKLHVFGLRMYVSDPLLSLSYSTHVFFILLPRTPTGNPPAAFSFLVQGGVKGASTTFLLHAYQPGTEVSSLFIVCVCWPVTTYIHVVLSCPSLRPVHCFHHSLVCLVHIQPPLPSPTHTHTHSRKCGGSHDDKALHRFLWSSRPSFYPM